jgi:imidazolonepropionase-like amidohydrolase
LDGPTVLRLWIDTSRVAISPDRKVGCLKAGCEADFLALGADPLKDFSATADIRQAWKDGVRLTLGPRRTGAPDQP